MFDDARNKWDSGRPWAAAGSAIREAFGRISGFDQVNSAGSGYDTYAMNRLSAEQRLSAGVSGGLSVGMWAAGSVGTIGRGASAMAGTISRSEITASRAVDNISRISGEVQSSLMNVAPAKRSTGITVLGNYKQSFPNYIELANMTGARHFYVPPKVWSGMTTLQKKLATEKFLARTVNRGDDILFSTRLENALPDSDFINLEVPYMLRNKYRFSEDGTGLLAPRVK